MEVAIAKHLNQNRANSSTFSMASLVAQVTINKFQFVDAVGHRTLLGMQNNVHFESLKFEFE